MKHALFRGLVAVLTVCDKLLAQHFGAASVARPWKIAEDILREQVSYVVPIECFTTRGASS